MDKDPGENLLVIFLIFILFLFNGAVIYLLYQNQEGEKQELKKIAYKIEDNYLELKSKTNMDCIIGIESNINKKRIDVYLNENKTIKGCSEQITQFTKKAIKEPFTLNVIEYK